MRISLLVMGGLALIAQVIAIQPRPRVGVPSVWGFLMAHPRINDPSFETADREFRAQEGNIDAELMEALGSSRSLTHEQLIILTVMIEEEATDRGMLADAVAEEVRVDDEDQRLLSFMTAMSNLDIASPKVIATFEKIRDSRHDGLNLLADSYLSRLTGKPRTLPDGPGPR